MKIDITAFKQGIEKKAEELGLTSSIRNFIMEKAGLFDTKDTADSILDTPGAETSELEAAKAILSRAYPDMLAGGGIGAGLGGLAGSITSSSKNKKRNSLLGGALGAGLGGSASLVNYLRQVQQNSQS